MEIVKKEFLGMGAHWKVERLYLCHSYSVNGKDYKQIVMKVSIGGDINNNIDCYRVVVESGLKTLAFYKEEMFNGNRVIFTEDINEGEILYVSPNSARNMISGNISTILNIACDQENRFNQQNSKAEEQLKRNKIVRVDNYEDLIKIIYNDMQKASKKKLGMCEDAFFFGVSINDNINVDYKIADFDTLIIYDLRYNDELTHRNTIVMLNSLWEFVDNFVEKNVFHNDMKYDIEKRTNDLRKLIKND